MSNNRLLHNRIWTRLICWSRRGKWFIHLTWRSSKVCTDWQTRDDKNIWVMSVSRNRIVKQSGEISCSTADASGLWWICSDVNLESSPLPLGQITTPFSVISSCVFFIQFSISTFLRFSSSLHGFLLYLVSLRHSSLERNQI